MECQIISGREARQRKREKALEVLGGKCARCGFDDQRALQIDHTEGGGTAELREIGYYKILGRVIAGEDGYQLLCANCNWIKRWENGEGHAFPQEIEIVGSAA